MAEADIRPFDRAEQRRLKMDKLLQVAASCFNEKGFSGTALKDVAQRLGLTDAALYYYVRNKEELVYACYSRAADVGADAMTRARAAGGRGLDQAERYLRYHIRALTGPEGPIAIMSEIPVLAAAHKAEILQRSRAHSRGFELILETGISDGSISPCDVRMTGNAVMSTINWLPKWFRGSDPELRQQVEDSYVALLIDGLALR